MSDGKCASAVTSFSKQQSSTEQSVGSMSQGQETGEALVAPKDMHGKNETRGSRMTVQDKARWKQWADCLRQEMMGSRTPNVTKSVEAIVAETATTKNEKTVRSERFWLACQAGTSPNDTLTKAGFEIEFEAGDDRRVEEVTLRLNQTWMDILQRVLDRQNA